MENHTPLFKTDHVSPAEGCRPAVRTSCIVIAELLCMAVLPRTSVATFILHCKLMCTTHLT